MGDVAERLVGLSEDDLDRVERGDLPETDLVALWEGVRCKGFVGLLRLLRRGSSIDVELEKYREVEPRVTQAAKDAGGGSLGSDPLSVEAKAAEFCEEVREAAYVSYGCSPSRAHGPCLDMSFSSGTVWQGEWSISAVDGITHASARIAGLGA